MPISACDRKTGERGRTVTTIDFNSDLAEGFGVWRLVDDDSMLAAVSSANIACGGHGGDPSIMRRACAGAAARGVAVGAHVGYRDLSGFGRRAIDVPPEALTNDIMYQLGALSAFAKAAGTSVTYVKPHGALYNRIVTDEQQAEAVVTAVRLFDPGLAVLGLPGSVILAKAAAAGLRTVREGFLDRAYNDDGTLLSRSLPGALLTDPAVVAERAVQLAAHGTVTTITGKTLAVAPETMCLHGDTPGAVELADAVRHALTDAGIEVVPFAKASVRGSGR